MSQHNIHIPITMKNIYHLKVRNLEGKVVREGFAENLVTTNGLNFLASMASTSYNAWASGLVVGSGSTEPAQSNLSLNSTVAGTEDVRSTSGVREYNAGDPTLSYVEFSIEYRFPTGAAAGNLTEVGIVTPENFVDVANRDLATHALIRDGAGNPTSITVLADEILDATVYLRQYPYLNGDITGTVSGINYTIRPVSFQDGATQTFARYSAEFNSSTGSPRLSAYNNSEPLIGFTDTANPLNTNAVYRASTSGAFDARVATGAYSPGTFTRDVTITFGTGDFNTTGVVIVGVRFGPFNYHIKLDPGVDKSDLQEMKLVLNFTWGNASGV